MVARLESVGVESHADVGGLGGSCGGLGGSCGGLGGSCVAGDVVDLPVGAVALGYRLVEWLPYPLPAHSLNKSVLVGLK